MESTNTPEFVEADRNSTTGKTIPERNNCISDTHYSCEHRLTLQTIDYLTISGVKKITSLMKPFVSFLSILPNYNFSHNNRIIIVNVSLQLLLLSLLVITSKQLRLTWQALCTTRRLNSYTVGGVSTSFFY
uniref:Transmembrane protein n=1 Tax=Heterorhabditis bacteriophora TaxID=37862 RepID=A0A1I7WIB1_HETBA